MHRHVSKHVKMHRMPTGGINKQGKHNIVSSGKGEGCAWSNLAFRDASRMVTPKQGLVGIRCNQTRSSLWRVSNMAKPRTREANTSIKHKGKQAQTCK